MTQRDKAKAMDFLNMMKKVAPPMGIEVHVLVNVCSDVQLDSSTVLVLRSYSPLMTCGR